MDGTQHLQVWGGPACCPRPSQRAPLFPRVSVFSVVFFLIKKDVCVEGPEANRPPGHPSSLPLVNHSGLGWGTQKARSLQSQWAESGMRCGALGTHHPVGGSLHHPDTALPNSGQPPSQHGQWITSPATVLWESALSTPAAVHAAPTRTATPPLCEEAEGATAHGAARSVDLCRPWTCAVPAARHVWRENSSVLSG